jgi:hypothetical protein
MTLHAPQIILIAISLLGTGMQIAKHGERRDDKYNGGLALFADAMMFGLLYWGGFFG